MGSRQHVESPRSLRPTECEVSRYRHGCDPPDSTRAVLSFDDWSYLKKPSFFPRSLPNLVSLYQYQYFQSRRFITCGVSVKSFFHQGGQNENIHLWFAIRIANTPILAHDVGRVFATVQWFRSRTNASCNDAGDDNEQCLRSVGA
jgi:hypothetical protein